MKATTICSMRALIGRAALVVASALLLASCGPTPGVPVGTWKATNGNDQFEFLKDGTVLSSGMSGTWRKADDGRYLLTFQMYGSTASYVAEKDGDMLRLNLSRERFECLARYMATDNSGMVMLSKPRVSTRAGRCT
jgi:hypothetical protein